MKLQDILKTQVDIFSSGSRSGKIYYTQTLYYFLTKLAEKNKKTVFKLRDLNKTDEKVAKQYKKDNLIACTVSATFDQYRVLHHIKERTGLIAIDIDKDKNPDLDTDKAKKELIKLPYIAWIQLSCRGEGIWCLIPYNKDNNFRDTWNSLREDFLNLGYVIDDCKDETRLRFVSWDDNIFAKKEVEVYDKVKPFEYIMRDIDYNADDWELTKDDIKDITVAIYLLTHYCGYSADDYNDWLLEGFRLATIPNKEVGLRLFKMISEASDNYEGYNDVKKKFNECCRTTTYRTNILGYYINKIKEFYGLEWRIKANELLGQNTIA